MTSPAQRQAARRALIEEKAHSFASEINDTLHDFLNTDENYLSVVAVDRKISVKTQGAGVALKVGGTDRFRLSVHYHCELSESGKYLAVDSSKFNVFELTVGMPLLRYDYLRKPRSRTPGAHINFRMDSAAADSALEHAGDNRRTRTRRGRHHGEGHGLPSELHLPVGGPRFRPCLEDVLEFLVTDLAVDCSAGWRDAIVQGRQVWRDRQLRAAVSDNPLAAIDSLSEMGYEVRWLGGSEAEPELRAPRISQF
jgi:hypothetical protein